MGRGFYIAEVKDSTRPVWVEERSGLVGAGRRAWTTDADEAAATQETLVVFAEEHGGLEVGQKADYMELGIAGVSKG